MLDDEGMSLYGVASNSLAGVLELNGELDTKRNGDEEARAFADEEEEEELDDCVS